MNNNLYDLYLAYQGKRNIFQEVKEFQKQEFQSQNFQAVMAERHGRIKQSCLQKQSKCQFNYEN